MKIIILSFSILLPYIAFTQPLDSRSRAYFDSITKIKPDPYNHPHTSAIAEIPVTTYSDIYNSTQRPDSSYVIQKIPTGFGIYTDTVYLFSAHSADSLYDVIKSRYIGKKFVFNPMILYTNSSCKCAHLPPTGTVWTVKDLYRLDYAKTANWEQAHPVGYERLICKSANGDCVMVDLTYFDQQRTELIYTPERAAKLKLKYGTIFWNAILEGSVKFGMNQEMCERSWGKPTSTSITHSINGIIEKWFYYFPGHTQYLYFTDGHLTAFQP